MHCRTGNTKFLGHFIFCQIEQMVKCRRSIRLYKKVPIPREKLEKLLDLLRYAQTARNVQEIHYTILNSPQQVS